MGNPNQIQSLGTSYLIVGIIVFTTLMSIYSSIQVSQQHDQIIALQNQLAEFNSAEGSRNQQFNNLKVEITQSEGAKISSLQDELDQLKNNFYNYKMEMMAKMSTFRIETEAIMKEYVEKSVYNQTRQSDQQVSELKIEQKVSELKGDMKGIQKDIEAISPLMNQQFNQLKDSLNQVNQSVILLQATNTSGANNNSVDTNDLSNLSNKMNDINQTIIQLKYDLTELKTKLNISGQVYSDFNNIVFKSDIETVKASIQSEIESVRNQITSHEVQKLGPFTAIHSNYFMTIDTKGIYPIATQEPCIIQLEKRSLVSLLATGVAHMFGPGQIIFLINGKTNLPPISIQYPHVPFGAGFLYTDHLPIYHQESFVLNPGTYEIQLGARAESGSGTIEFNLISFIATIVS